MTKRIQSDALVLLNRMLGIAGGAGFDSQTLLDDGNVSQVIELGAVVRRSRTPGVSSGLFMGILENDHPAAGVLTATFNPYVPGTVNANGYPSPVARGFDFWLLGCYVVRSSGAGTLDGAALFVNPSGQQQGWGVDAAGATVTASNRFAVARWTGLDTSLSGVDGFGITGDGSAYVRPLIRIGRGSTLQFVSDVAAASAEMRCVVLSGLFPEALGQDVAQ